MKILLIITLLLLSCSKENPVSSDCQRENCTSNANIPVVWQSGEMDSVGRSNSDLPLIGFMIPDGHFWSGVVFHVSSDTPPKYVIRHNSYNNVMVENYVYIIGATAGEKYRTYFFRK
jgi:hypothetical protein